jgi:ATP-dependent helicase/nuclease subunit A
MLPASDARTRERALDPARSFVVHAPAGSGKTELLIQRLLALLARVQSPEQILAITFTRKAAAEMRNRVLDALDDACNPVEAPIPHKERTRALAGAVLEADRRHGWELLTNPDRLRIQTIDAFNQWLAQNRPFGPGSTAGATIVRDPTRFYDLAVRQLFRSLDEDNETGRALRYVLRHKNNDHSGVAQMLSDLLPRRDQWLRYLAGTPGPELRGQLERSFANLTEDVQRVCLDQLAPAEIAALADLARHAAVHAEDPRSRELLGAWAAYTGEFEARAEHRGLWQGIAHLLLTARGAWRRQLGAGVGFGAAHGARRHELRALLDALSRRSELAAQLHRVAELPPLRYSDAQWRVLNALRIVLVRLAAELAVVFAEHAVADFVEVALVAQRALGATEQPSELLLALDRRIEHLLVDEYQDTSHMQHALLALLTAGWQPDDGRTLFLVGDPMQSIYRFRDADVRLFLNATRVRFGQVTCEPLKLTDNFRGAPTLVQWVNRAFARMLPSVDDPVTGTARFEPSFPRRENGERQEIQLHAIRAAAHEAEIQRVCELVVQERRLDPEQSIAVLVHSRTHLRGLGEALARHGQAVDTVEIDSLTRNQTGQDLIGLTRALLHLADRGAWLAALRAPWCGLRWRDLEILSRGAAERTIWEVMHDERRLARLSPDGRVRLLACRAHLRGALDRRGTRPLAEWIESVWRGLGGSQCLARQEDRRWAELFFDQLGQMSEGEDLDDPAALAEAMARVQLEGERAASAKLYIMTVHRAKGLEFDTVVLLGLAREPRPGSPGALSWTESINASGRRDLLLAPLGAHTGATDALGRYLWQLEQQKASAERIRLLYVAMTRARERLHLVARLGPTADSPAPRSLLAPLWAEFGPRFGPPSVPAEVAEPAQQSVILPLTRLRTPSGAACSPAALRPAPGRPRFDWASVTAAHVGTVVHRELAVLAGIAPTARRAEWLGTRQRRYARELELLGVAHESVESAALRVVHALQSVLEDSRGRWILEAHSEAESEVTLQRTTADGIEQMRLDRTFVDATGRRWIIDYKVGLHEGGDLEGFFEAEVARYAPQLQHYAEAMRLIDTRPIELGLYFPLHRHFRCWSACL